MRFLFGLGLLPLVNGLNCDADPFSIPFEEIPVIVVPRTIQSPHKSLGLIFGSEKRLLAMGFGTTSNSSFVPDSDKLCNPEAFDVNGCVFWRGGLFSPGNSSSWEKDKRTTEYNGSASNEGWDYLNAENYQDSGDDPLTAFTRGWDTVDLGEKTLHTYPFSIIENSSFPFGTGMVGLASDSVFLRSATKEGIAPSKSWGFDYGEFIDDEETSGELVIGGYNSAKASYNDFTNYTIFPDKTKPCPLQVRVEGLKWGSVDLMEGQSSFMACLEPAYWTMIMPLQVQSNWNTSLTDDHGYTFWQNTWEFAYYNSTDDSSFPDADLEVTLEKGFTVNIPSRELYRGAKAINGTEGGWDPIEGSIQTNMGTAGFPPEVEPKLPFLGGPFLSQVYLAVDYENMILSLSKTNRESNSESLGLRALACDNAGSEPASTKPPGENKKPKIIGGVVGGTLGLISLAGIIFYFFFYRRRQPTAQIQEATVSNNDKKDDDVPRYSSPFAPYGAYPPPPPESITSMSPPYGYIQGQYSSISTWPGSPPLSAQQLPATTDEGGVSGGNSWATSPPVPPQELQDQSELGGSQRGSNIGSPLQSPQSTGTMIPEQREFSL